MKKQVILLAIISAFTINAYATGAQNNCNGNGSCATNTTNNTTNQGGAGGVAFGGSSNASSTAYGGNGVAVGTGGNASVGNVNAINGGNTVDVSNRNSNINGNANTNKVESSNVQGQIQGQDQKQSTSNANNSTNTSNVSIAGDNFEAKRIPVNTAFAPSIPATATCTLSVSGGVSVIGFSGSFGHAYVDKNCEKLEKVRNVALVLGDIATAEALQCQDADYAKARLTIGRPCPVEQE